MTHFTNLLFEYINNFLMHIIFFDIFFFIDQIKLPIILAIICFCSVYFTLRLGFVNIRFFKHAVKLLLTKSSFTKDKHISSFKALMTSLSATVGLGNIAGVAIAISVGGPGATVWMIIMGLLGMSTKFVECTLSVMYRKKRSNGQFIGGPMVYLKQGLSDLGFKRLGYYLSTIFCILCIGGSFGAGTAFQVNQSFKALSLSIPFLQDMAWLYGIIMVFLVGLVIIGNIKRISFVASRIVPSMCGLYVLMACYILIIYYQELPAAIITILKGAIDTQAVFGGFFGVLVVGIQRAAFSNEAGLGSAAIVHSVARVDHPIKEGMVSLLEPFIDTVVICTMTALVIVVTGVYDNPDFASMVKAQEGAALTLTAMGMVVPWFTYLLSVVIFLFAFSTIISWSYYGERCFVFLFGDTSTLIYKISLLVIIFLGAIATSKHVLNFGDLLLLSMAFPNLIGLLLLFNKVKDSLKDYQKNYKNK